MIQTGIKFRDVIKEISDKLSIIIVVPAFIGGLWQALELLHISTPFLRFFSISQIVPDGLLILMLFLIPFIVPIFGLYFDKFFFSDEDAKEKARKKTREELHKSPKFNAILFVITFICACGIGLAYFFRIAFELQNIDSIVTAIMLAYFSVYIGNLSLGLCYELSTIKIREYIKYCNVFLLALYLLIGYSFAKEVHNKFLLNNKVDNIENIYSVLDKRYPKSKKRILYFNDKYIFVQILSIDIKSKKSLEKIHIMELEKLFND